MGIKLGSTLAQQCKKYAKACGKSGILHTKPINITNLNALNLTPRLNADVMKLSEESEFISKLLKKYKTSQININGESFTKFEGSQMGSNPAFWAKNSKTGELYYIKHTKVSDNEKKHHLESENLATKLYNLVGIQTPKTELCKLENGIDALKIKYAPKLQNISDFKQVHTGFAADAWLANWDALIDNNTRIVNGKIFKLDCGGCLKHRAQGALKTDFMERVKEIVTLVDSHNYQAASIYKNISHQDLVKSFKMVCNLTDEQIKATVNDSSMSRLLIDRRNYMRKFLEKIEQTPYDGKNIAQYLKNIQKEIDYREYSDITRDMISQRAAMVNTLHKFNSVDEELGFFKDGYVSQSRKIKNNIMAQLGNEHTTFNNNLTDCLKLDKLIAQSKLPRAITLYRGATPYDFGLDRMSSKEFIKKFYKKGKIFKIPTYPETSLDRKIGENYAKGRILFKINAGKDTPAIYMEDLNTPLSGYYGNEEEIMLARNLLYKFKNHIETPEFDILEIDIVKKAPFWKKVHNFWNEVPKRYWEN